MDLQNCTVAVIGLGYVGLPLAVEFGKKRSVVGFDISAERVAELQAAYDRTREVSEADLREARCLRLTANVASVRVEGTMVFIVTVPTPVDKSNHPDLGPIVRASETVGHLLRPKDLVIYESTVYPGATEEVCVPILERNSGMRLNVGFYCGYSPERINPGDKTRRLPDIKKITSGSTPDVARAIDSLYREIVSAGTHMAKSIKVAEAAKVIENAQRDINIAFVNELSLIFNRMSIDTTEVLEAANTKWNFLPFKPGLVGGHCIGVDPYYLTYKAQELGYQAQVILSGRRINDDMAKYAARNTIRLMGKNGINVAKATVGILGITFKENCPDIRNSKVFDIVRELQDWGLKVKITDPWADAKEVEKECGLELEATTFAAPVDSIIVAVGHNEFAKVTPAELRSLCFAGGTPVIADLKSLYDREDLMALGFEVFRF